MNNLTYQNHRLMINARQHAKQTARAIRSMCSEKLEFLGGGSTFVVVNVGKRPLLHKSSLLQQEMFLGRLWLVRYPWHWGNKRIVYGSCFCQNHSAKAKILKFYERQVSFFFFFFYPGLSFLQQGKCHQSTSTPERLMSDNLSFMLHSYNCHHFWENHYFFFFNRNQACSIYNLYN